MKKVLLVLFVLLLLVAAGTSWVVIRFKNTKPQGVAGPEADKVAKALQKRVHLEAWNKIGAIRWTFRRVHKHLWDKKRQYIQVEFGKKQQYKVQMALHARDRGIVWKSGKELPKGKQRSMALKLAYAFWANDSFWLNPITKLFDKGVTRKLVKSKGKEKRLLVSFSSGGVTPGDSYLFIIGKNGLPKSFQMWVKILPIPGISFDFGRWTQFKGAWLSLDHKLTRWSKVAIPLSAVKAYDSVQKIAGKDIFAPLQHRLYPPVRRAPVARRAASRPAPAAPVKRETKPAKVR